MVEFDGVGVDGVPTVGETLTVRTTWADGPLHPLAVTWMFTDPVNPFAHVIMPVDGSIDPAAGLLKLQLNPVVFVVVVA
jgi:hypothetical protein